MNVRRLTGMTAVTAAALTFGVACADDDGFNDPANDPIENPGDPADPLAPEDPDDPMAPGDGTMDD